MPLPKMPNGQKIAITVPGDVYRRLKVEAVEKHTLPSQILLEALEAFWEKKEAETRMKCKL